MPDDSDARETADERVVVYMTASLVSEVDKRVTATRKAAPDREYGRGTLIKEAVREYLRRRQS